MTQTVERRALSHPAPPPRRSANVLLPGAIAAAWSLAAGLVMFGLPVLLAWATDSRSGSGAAAATRTVGQLWLVAHGTALAVPGGTVHLTPLGLTAIPLLLLHRAGRHSARTAPVPALPEASLLVLAIAAPYALAAAVIAAFCATKQISPEPWQALLGGFGVAVLGSGSGVLRESRLFTAARRLPVRVRTLARATAIAALVLLAGGALVGALALLAHLGRVTALSSASDPGLVGGLALVLLCLSLVPNAAIWGISWVAGPGFAVGVGTSVSPWSTHLGAVPAFPLLGALPSGDTPVWMSLVALAVPLAAGAAGGVVIGRGTQGCSLPKAAAEGLLLAPAAGLVVAVLALVSGGPLGDGRLSAVGPSPWETGLMVLLEVAVPAAAGAALGAWRR